jgi:signal transduction histidine kinase
MINTLAGTSNQLTKIVRRAVLDTRYTPNLSLENNLLQILRMLILLRLVTALILVALANYAVIDEQLTWRVVSLVEITFLFIYLNLSFLRAFLGSAYLPIALVWASIVPLVIQDINLYWLLQSVTETANELSLPAQLVQTALSLANIAQTFPVILIPLIILSWRYSRSWIFFFCVTITLVELFLNMIVMTSTTNGLFFGIIVVLFQGFIMTLIGLVINYLVAQQTQNQQALIAANEKLRHYATVREQLATMQERNRLARELHDTLAHTLAAATVHMEAVRVIWNTQPEKAQSMVDQSVVMMRDGLTETRRALQALRAEPLDSLNLSDSFAVLAESIITRYQISVDVDAPQRITELPDGVEHGLYRIVQEALFNCVKHAQATHVQIHVQQDETGVSVQIRDNGIGFDPNQVNDSQHFGIQGMRERAQSIGADFRLSSAPGNGTTVALQLGR